MTPVKATWVPIVSRSMTSSVSGVVTGVLSDMSLCSLVIGMRDDDLGHGVLVRRYRESPVAGRQFVHRNGLVREAMVVGDVAHLAHRHEDDVGIAPLACHPLRFGQDLSTKT